MKKDRLLLNLGADGETRTRTACGHYPLKIACLPIPPRRHVYLKFYFGILCTGVFVSAGLSASGFFADPAAAGI